MYSKEILEIAKASESKSSMIKLAKNKELKSLILSETSFLKETASLKIRCLCILNGYTKENFPKCKSCDNEVSYHDEFHTFCSQKCAKEHGQLSLP